MGVLGEKKFIFRHFFGKGKNSYRYCVVENHKSYFKISQILFVVLISS
jgi:hypothetical protein